MKIIYVKKKFHKPIKKKSIKKKKKKKKKKQII